MNKILDIMKKTAVFALALAMAAGIGIAGPGTALADTSTQSDDLVLTKTANLNADGTYTFDLEAYATGSTVTTTTTTTITKAVPLDIVLVIDQSGSMTRDGYLAPLKKAVTGFVNTIYANGQETGVDHRVAIVGYASGNTTTQSSGSAAGRINGRTDRWFNTGIFLNSTFKNYKTSVTTTGYTAQKDKKYSDTYNKTTKYYYRDGDAYYQISTSYNSGTRRYTVTYKKNNQTVYLVTSKADAKFGYDLYTYGTSTVEADLTPQDYKDAMVSVANSTGTAVNSHITTSISNFGGNGGTHPNYGMEMAHNVFVNNPIEAGSGRERIVVVFTDGVPGETQWDSSVATSAIASASDIKKQDGAKIYTVGLYSSATSNTTNYMNYLSSNYPNAASMTSAGTRTDSKYYMTTSNSEELTKIFKTISEDVTTEITVSSTTVTLDADAVLMDMMTNGLVMTESSQITARTYQGTMNSSKVVTKGAETQTYKSLVCSKTDDVTAKVTGFDYAQKYISTGHPGEILHVTVTGVIPTDYSVQNAVMDTNDAQSGIYAKDSTTPAAVFPRPTTILTRKFYVMDYAKPFTMSAGDWKQSSTTLYGSFTKSAASADFGALKGMTYMPITSRWNGYDTFYAFGTTTDSEVKKATANAGGYLWSKVDVLPANNVYYEDEFETDSTTVGIVYSGDWTVVGTQGSNLETPSTPIHGGWQNGDLADDQGDSNGSSHLAAGTNSTATFEFYGTGVDVYTRTDTSTLTIIGMLYKITDGTETAIKMKFVNNYAEDSANSPYYQIPTLNFEDLDYGHYKVTIVVSGNSGNYYLDGIRVYNPLKGQENDDTVKDAYGDEINATFVEVRDILLDANSFTAGTSVVNGVVLIDKITDGETGVPTTSLGTYASLGPKNEVYLNPNQGVAFAVGNTAANLSVGLKAPKGSTSAQITNGENTSPLPIDHSTDLYYGVTPNDQGLVVIMNTGNSLLAVTKLKASGEISVGNIMYADLMSYSAGFESLASVPYVTDDETSAPDPSEPEDPTETEGSTDVTIEIPETPASQTPTRISQLLQSILNAFKRSK